MFTIAVIATAVTGCIIGVLWLILQNTSKKSLAQNTCNAEFYESLEKLWGVTDAVGQEFQEVRQDIKLLLRPESPGPQKDKA